MCTAVLHLLHTSVRWGSLGYERVAIMGRGTKKVENHCCRRTWRRFTGLDFISPWTWPGFTWAWLPVNQRNGKSRFANQLQRFRWDWEDGVRHAYANQTSQKTQIRRNNPEFDAHTQCCFALSSIFPVFVKFKIFTQPILAAFSVTGESVLRCVEDPGQKEPRRHDHATGATKPTRPEQGAQEFVFCKHPYRHDKRALYAALVSYWPEKSRFCLAVLDLKKAKQVKKARIWKSTFKNPKLATLIGSVQNSVFQPGFQEPQGCESGCYGFRINRRNLLGTILNYSSMRL